VNVQIHDVHLETTEKNRSEEVEFSQRVK
jgi:hypothetical protein